MRTGLAHIRVAVSDRAAFDPATTIRTFRVAMNDYAEFRLAGPLARELEALAPGVRVVIRRSERLFVAPEEERRTGSADAAIGFFADAGAADPAMRIQDLFTEKNVVIARRGHPILRRRLTPASLASAEHVAVFHKVEPRGLIDSVLASQNLERRLKVRTPHFLAVPHIVANSDLIACALAGLAQPYAPWLQLAIRPIPIKIPPFTMRLVWHDRTADDPAQRWFQAILSHAAS